jgi:hypothetical protein
MRQKQKKLLEEKEYRSEKARFAHCHAHHSSFCNMPCCPIKHEQFGVSLNSDEMI